MIEEARERFTTHGGLRHRGMHPLYQLWQGMHARCTNPKHISWCYYGALGVTVCERWNDFANFVADMGPRPPGTTLERNDTNGDYEPNNCRWATYRDQRLNQRRMKEHSL